jgi:hypothetical protein
LRAQVFLDSRHFQRGYFADDGMHDGLVVRALALVELLLGALSVLTRQPRVSWLRL